MTIGVRLRPGRPEDAAELGAICYQAFRSIAVAHSYEPDFPSPEVSTALLSQFLAHPRFCSIVAEQDGRLVGSNFLDERNPIHGIGPITVDPTVQDRGIGRSLMEAVLERSRNQGAPGSRLVQAAYHRRSFALYVKLGFAPRELLVCLQGTPPKSRLNENRSARPATSSDLLACGELCKKVHGFDRNGEIADAIRAGTASVVEARGRIIGYATSVAFFGHQVGETTADLRTMISAASAIQGPGMLVPARNAELLRWGLEGGLKIVQTMTLMSTGAYQEPVGAYIPSVNG